MVTHSVVRGAPWTSRSTVNRNSTPSRKQKFSKPNIILTDGGAYINPSVQIDFFPGLGYGLIASEVSYSILSELNYIVWLLNTFI